jgi:hypothetical protein
MMSQMWADLEAIAKPGEEEMEAAGRHLETLRAIAELNQRGADRGAGNHLATLQAIEEKGADV